MISRTEREVAERNLHRGTHSEIGLAEVSESREFMEFMTNAELLKSVKEFGERMDAIAEILKKFNEELCTYLDSVVEPGGGSSSRSKYSDAFDRAFNGKPDFSGLTIRRRDR